MIPGQYIAHCEIGTIPFAGVGAVQRLNSFSLAVDNMPAASELISQVPAPLDYSITCWVPVIQNLVVVVCKKQHLVT